jgi:hypothetical protein
MQLEIHFRLLVLCGVVEDAIRSLDGRGERFENNNKY